MKWNELNWTDDWASSSCAPCSRPSCQYRAEYRALIAWTHLTNAHRSVRFHFISVQFSPVQFISFLSLWTRIETPQIRVLNITAPQFSFYLSSKRPGIHDTAWPGNKIVNINKCIAWSFRYDSTILLLNSLLRLVHVHFPAFLQNTDSAWLNTVRLGFSASHLSCTWHLRYQ